MCQPRDTSKIRNISSDQDNWFALTSQSQWPTCAIRSAFFRRSSLLQSWRALSSSNWLALLKFIVRAATIASNSACLWLGGAQAPSHELDDYRQYATERQQASPPRLMPPRHQPELGCRNGWGDRVVASPAAYFQVMRAWSHPGDGDVPLHRVGPMAVVHPVGKPHQLLGLVVQGREFRPDLTGRLVYLESRDGGRRGQRAWGHCVSSDGDVPGRRWCRAIRRHSYRPRTPPRRNRSKPDRLRL